MRRRGRKLFRPRRYVVEEARSLIWPPSWPLVRATRQGVTLVELLFVTVILGFLAMLIAGPLGRVRERAMVSATAQDIKNLQQAIERYVTVEQEWPTTLDDLDDDYEQSEDVLYCTFTPTAGADLASSFVDIAAMHRGSVTLLSTRYPVEAGKLTESKASSSSCPAPKKKKSKVKTPKKKKGA